MSQRLAMFVLAALSASSAFGQCTGSFSTAFRSCDLDAPVRASVVFDDGSGPALIVGGDFKTAGGIATSLVARWNGANWSAMGSAILTGSVSCFTVFDDDGPGPHPAALYAGGSFTLGGQTGIMKWDGSEWSLVPGSPQALCLTVFDDDDAGPNFPALYAGGTSPRPGGLSTNRIARWDGAAWTDAGLGLEGSIVGASAASIYVLCSHDDDGPGPNPPVLFAGGYIGYANGQTANHIVRWSGTTWLPLTIGTTGMVTNLLSWDADGAGPAPAALIVGGGFTFAGGAPAHYIARWDGSAWSTLGIGPQSEPKSMMLWDEDGPGPNPERLWVGTSTRIERYDGSAWTTQYNVGQSPSSSLFGVQTMALMSAPGDPEKRLFAAGGFGSIDGRGVNYITRIGRGGPESLGGGQGLNRAAQALASFDDDGPGPRPPALYVGGDFWSAGTSGAAGVARWNPNSGGGSWETLGAGLKPGSSQVRMLAVYDEDGSGPIPPRLYAGGFLVLQEGNISCKLARWDGVHWTAVDATPDFVPYGLSVADPDGDGPQPPALYACGYSDTAFVWQFDPATLGWVGVGSSLPRVVYTLAAFDDDGPGPHPTRLYIGTGGHTGSPDSIYVWSGSTWDLLSGGVAGEYSEVNQLLVMDEDGSGPAIPSLYLGGVFQALGGYLGVPSPSVGRWRGEWSSASGGLNPGMQAPGFGSHAIGSFTEPGSSLPALYAASFVVQSTSNLFRWTPGLPVSTWMPVSTGTTGSLCCTNVTGPVSMLEFDDDGPGAIPPALYIAGGFTGAGGVPSFGIARWSCPALCYANCDNSTATPLLTANDFQCFLNKFAAADAYANCDGSTNPPVLTANDFQCFLNKYAAGCS